MAEPRVAVVIVAAGRGERAGSPGSGPKQYRAIGNKAVLRHTMDAFAEALPQALLTLVVHRDDEALLGEAMSGFADPFQVAFGGATRQASVLAGLIALAETLPDIVLIHDGARPFTDASTIRRVVAAVAPGIGALPATAVSDTLKRADGEGMVTATVDRAGLYGAQTPQGFVYGEIASAHRAAHAAGIAHLTDDAAVAEWAGLRIRLVEGAPGNTKITLPADLVRANERLKGAHTMIDVRTGNGYDVHQLVPGDHVTLCGVKIPSDMALSGHSDADVGLHALTDALLATCGAGDIGTHFPPSDMQWRGAASRIFVAHAVELLRRAGGRICNMDVTLICEAPKIAPHREAMRAAMADMTGVELGRISVKATTNETIGFIGRREGIAAIATASVVFGDGA